MLWLRRVRVALRPLRAAARRAIAPQRAASLASASRSNVAPARGVQRVGLAARTWRGVVVPRSVPARYCSSSSSSSSDEDAVNAAAAEAVAASENLDKIDLNDDAEVDAAILEASGLVGKQSKMNKRKKGGPKAQLPKRFMDMIHLNRLSFVKRRLKYREEQWKKRKKDLAYDIPTLDLKIEGLKSKEDQDWANERIEELREIVDRDGRWPTEYKRLLLLQAKEVLGAKGFWELGEDGNPIPEITPLELDEEGNVVEAEFDEHYNIISKQKD